ncbi:zinc-ribbon domain-containing protein [Lancefieldella rimae]|uniref:zinc ribbon domain-containing protein n=1 Tax=Lancefieldella rimae TaxID=1383 RepID=UPI003C6ECD3E
MFCTNCGTQMPEGQKFCTNCGAALQSAEHLSQPSQAMDPNVTQKTPESTQAVATTQKASISQPATQTQNNSANPSSSQNLHKHNKKMIAVIALVLVLVVGGVGAATYFTNGFGLLDKQGEAGQTADTTSGSSDSSAADTKKKKKDADEKPTVKVSDISFDTTQAVSAREIRDVYSIKGTIENTTDNYVEASPSFIFKVSYKDKYGDEQSGDAILQSQMETPDGFENETIFLAPHEKKEFTYYIYGSSYNENSHKEEADATFNIVTTKQSNSTPNNLSLAKGDITVDSVELKECPFKSFTNKKALTPDDAKVSLSCTFEQFSSTVTGTVTNTTQDKWSSATVYYHTEMDGYYVLRSSDSSSVSFVKPDASADIKGSSIFGSNQDGHTYEVKPIAVTYQVDKN